jgi:hypothetical protein
MWPLARKFGHVPGVATQIVVQQELGLAVAADARARDRRGIGGEFVLLHADRSHRARRGREPGDRAVGSAGTDQVSGAQIADRPQPVAVTLDVGHRDAEVQLGTARAQQEVVELDAADEPAAAADGAILAGVANMAGPPLPQAARVALGQELELVPDRFRQPAAAQLDPRE